MYVVTTLSTSFKSITAALSHAEIPYAVVAAGHGYPRATARDDGLDLMILAEDLDVAWARLRRASVTRSKDSPCTLIRGNSAHFQARCEPKQIIRLDFCW